MSECGPQRDVQLSGERVRVREPLQGRRDLAAFAARTLTDSFVLDSLDGLFVFLNFVSDSIDFR